MYTAADYDRHYKGERDLLNTFREHADRFLYVMKFVKSTKPDSILDIGCNRGLFGSLVQWRHGYAPTVLVGVDHSRVVLDDAEMNGYKTHQIDATISFDLHQKFDLVLVMEILEHVYAPAAIIQNALRHARRHVLFSTPEEHGEIDGEVHVAQIDLLQLQSLVEQQASVLGLRVRIDPHFLPSLFCEKPKWQGWNFIHVEVLS